MTIVMGILDRLQKDSGSSFGALSSLVQELIPKPYSKNERFFTQIRRAKEKEVGS
jgi:hypothetical protein